MPTYMPPPKTFTLRYVCTFQTVVVHVYSQVYSGRQDSTTEDWDDLFARSFEGYQASKSYS